MTDAHRYRYCGLVIRSERPLPELAPTDAGEAVLDLVWTEARPLDEQPDHPAEALANRGEDEFCAFTSVDGIDSLWFEDIGVFRFEAETRAITCTPDPEIDTETLHHIVLDQILPRVLAERGEAILHASAVEIDGVAVAFAARSGSGKSTLAAAFDQAGHAVLTDDVLRLEYRDGELWAHASYPGLRLWPRHAAELLHRAEEGEPVAGYTEKRRFLKGGRMAVIERAPFPLVRWYVIEADAPEGAPIEIRDVSRRDALVASMGNAFHIGVEDADVHAENLRIRIESPLLERAGALVYPRDLELLPAVVDAVVADVRRRR